MNRQTQLLLVEDDAALSAALVKALTGRGYAVEHVRTGDKGMRHALERKYDVVLTDLRLPGMGGMELVERLGRDRPGLPVILLTAHGTTKTAIQATQRGAYDYLLKPFAVPDLLAMISRALEQTRDRPDAAPTRTAGNDEPIVGRSRAMQEVLKEIGRVAARDVTLLITGETGTGKEIVARTVWRHSNRAREPFLAINCAAIPESLLESELFGHEKGAFTGADARRIGRFEQATGGTLFLDEIGDISPATQVRLLRVLQERTIQRVGGRETTPVDVRIIAATHRNLETAVARGEFRDDLYFRLSVVQIHVPALRDRPDDIALLASHFAETAAERFGVSCAGLRREAIERLANHSWPGNVRELENAIHRALLCARGLPITATVIDQVLTRPVMAPSMRESQTLAEMADAVLNEAARENRGKAHARMMAAAEFELLDRAMRFSRGNQTRAARLLGLSRVTLRARLRQHGLHPDSEKAGTDASLDSLGDA